ncbi:MULTISPECIES: YihY/virulence factor BrkB family protein [unclassified Pseudomonas]|jgi:membrane protein|uniref:YihY/virulence factor BrkB family protein n=1 Tax=unclassified Pseudomonas TaxID=196821 RepID=UPI0019EB6A04|nr:YihY/virulence factor BrkB family protein [Pseudomonas sp.]MBF0676399.1 YihY/virulence factor BrkB family protein [Pseudomonas sp.]
MFALDLRGMGIVQLFKCAVKEFSEDEMPTYAAALSFQALFSLFPFLLFLVALISFFDLQPFFDWLREQAALLLPGQAMEQVDKVILQFQSQKAGLFSFAILIALWTASAGVRSMMVAMNRAYDVPEGRPMWKLYPLSTFYTLGIALMLLSAAALMVVGPTLMGRLAGLVGFEDYLVILWAWLRWPVAILLLIVAVAVIYYVTPDVKQEFRFITPGSLVAVLVWIAASLGFGVYVQNFADYSATYGSIGAIIVMLMYFYISAAVLLFGAELNAVIEHQDPQGKDPGEKVA